ncbi:hypothetical protein DENSPDRAFT_876326 [Dentipellis sp. KUC8613]|nr:hypothetical protein DENSPDRAFT_876326 [Dentipellis sp. KUC8613]
MSILARAPAAARSQILRSRLAAPSRGVHEYKHMPFKHDNSKAFAVKLISFLSVGFAIPIVAAQFQLRKASA